MNDNDLIALIIAILRAGLDSVGLSAVAIRQSYQPTQQGVPEGPALFLHKILAPRYGWPGNRSVYNIAEADFDTETTIWRTPTFQVSGLSQQDPGDVTQLTASDITETAADILQTPATRETLKQSDVSVLRITLVRLLYFVNDKDRHEQEPSFDVTFNYRRVFASKTPAVTTFGTNIVRV